MEVIINSNDYCIINSNTDRVRMYASIQCIFSTPRRLACSPRMR